MASLKCPKCKSPIAADVFSCPFCNAPLEEELVYAEYEDGCAVVGPKEKTIRLAKVESTYLGKPVKAILEGAFKDCVKLTSILISDGLLHIGAHAFEGCVKLGTAVIPASVVTVGEYAYAGCVKLDDLTLGNGINKVGSAGICYCRNLTAMRYSGGMNALGDAAAFTCTCGAMNLKNGLEEIGEYAFMGCLSLKDVYVPEGVKRIGLGAFSGCKTLSSAQFPLTIEDIASPFEGCAKLKSIRYNGSKAKWLAAYKNELPAEGVLRVACMDGIAIIK